ncbi:AlpA family phage regulatory protein [Dyella monticola]|uniref:AlpA family phage regulatory protein n=1 Tax=Dyella monticola TaxID=1927958 RepID=A0A370X9A9_9GAMM|nr:AlpA family phage regulatory protein [Dyella monticola]RDS85013.1 AlpA family phage regulatory protein [Dyella monticola]
MSDRKHDGKPWREAERENHRAVPAPAFYRIRDVLRITALTRPTLYRRMAAGRFPLPVHLGGRACAWATDALQAWISDPEGYRESPKADPLVRRRPGRPRKYMAD